MEPQERFAFTGVDVNKILAKKRTVIWKAYALAYNNFTVPKGSQKIHVSVILDCDGDPVPLEVSGEGSASTALNCPGAEWAFPRFTCYMAHGWFEDPGFIIDLRSWWSILAGCCLPEGMDHFD